MIENGTAGGTGTWRAEGLARSRALFSSLEDLPEPPPWAGGALCAQTDPDIFFPEKGGSTRDAKAVCGRCDVREQCLQYALANEERYGIWGGRSPRELAKIAKGLPLPELSNGQLRRRHRERQIRALLRDGLTFKEAADRLEISEGSVRRISGASPNHG